jgi:hypothetical protein
MKPTEIDVEIASPKLANSLQSEQATSQSNEKEACLGNWPSNST